MPALHTCVKPAEEGWSKQHEEDLIERTFMATFPAFKFPDRERLHVSCGVQLCKGKCPNVSTLIHAIILAYKYVYVCVCDLCKIYQLTNKARNSYY